MNLHVPDKIMNNDRLFSYVVRTLCFILFAGIITLTECAYARGPSDEAWYDPSIVELPREQRYKGMVYSSRYLTMRDGVKIAIDLYLPKGLEQTEKIPTILRQTRYYRSMELRWPYRSFLRGTPYDHTTLYAKRRKT